MFDLFQSISASTGMNFNAEATVNHFSWFRGRRMARGIRLRRQRCEFRIRVVG